MTFLRWLKFRSYLIANGMMIYAIAKYYPQLLTYSQRKLALTAKYPLTYKQIKYFNQINYFNYSDFGKFRLNLIADYYRNKSNNQKSIHNFKEMLLFIHNLYINKDINAGKIYVYRLLVTTNANRFHFSGNPSSPRNIRLSDGRGLAYPRWSHAIRNLKQNHLKRSNTRLLHSSLHCKYNVTSLAELHAHLVLFSFGKTDQTDSSLSAYMSNQLKYQVSAHIQPIYYQGSHTPAVFNVSGRSNKQNKKENGAKAVGDAAEASENCSGSDSEDVSVPDESLNENPNSESVIGTNAKTYNHDDLIGGSHMSDIDKLKAMGPRRVAIYVMMAKNSAHGSVSHPIRKHYNFSFSMFRRHIESKLRKSRHKAHRDAIPYAKKIAIANAKRRKTIHRKQMIRFKATAEQIKRCNRRDEAEHGKLNSMYNPRSLQYGKAIMWYYFNATNPMNGVRDIHRITVPLQKHILKVFKKCANSAAHCLAPTIRYQFLTWFAKYGLPRFIREWSSDNLWNTSFTIYGNRPAWLTHALTHHLAEYEKLIALGSVSSHTELLDTLAKYNWTDQLRLHLETIGRENITAKREKVYQTNLHHKVIVAMKHQESNNKDTRNVLNLIQAPIVRTLVPLAKRQAIRDAINLIHTQMTNTLSKHNQIGIHTTVAFDIDMASKPTAITQGHSDKRVAVVRQQKSVTAVGNALVSNMYTSMKKVFVQTTTVAERTMWFATRTSGIPPPIQDTNTTKRTTIL